MPYLVKGPLDSDGQGGGSAATKPLLQDFYGYRVNTARERTQVVQKLSDASDRQALHVAQMWFLILGDGKSYEDMFGRRCH